MTCCGRRAKRNRSANEGSVFPSEEIGQVVRSVRTRESGEGGVGRRIVVESVCRVCAASWSIVYSETEVYSFFCRECRVFLLFWSLLRFLRYFPLGNSEQCQLRFFRSRNAGNREVSPYYHCQRDVFILLRDMLDQRTAGDIGQLLPRF